MEQNRRQLNNRERTNRDGDRLANRSSRDHGDGDTPNDRRRGNSSFVYRERDPEATKRRAESTGNDFDTILMPQVKVYKVKDGDNDIRILPPTFADAEHYGIDVWVHYGIGPDRESYLCLNKMKGEKCPICDERMGANRDGDEDLAKELEAKRRVLFYLVDRSDEKTGAQAWLAPMGVDRDILKISVDKKSGEVLQVDNPDDGYDVSFEKFGKGIKTQYEGITIARRASPLNNDEAMEFAVENPLPEILQYFSYAHIQSIFGGGTDVDVPVSHSKTGHGSADSDRGSHPNRGHRDWGGGTSSHHTSGRGSRNPDAGQPTWQQIHEMNFDELCDLAEAQRLDIDPDKSKDDSDLADWICEEMRIKDEPKASKKSGDPGGSDAEERLSRMRSRRED